NNGHTFAFARSPLAAALRAAAPLAAVFPEIIRERLQLVVGRLVVDEGALAAGRDQAGGGEALQVVAERRRGDVQLVLDVARRRAVGAPLHDVAEDRETDGVSQRAELLGVTIEFRRHEVL